MIHEYYIYNNEADTSIIADLGRPDRYPRPVAFLNGQDTASTCNGLYEATGQDSIGRLNRDLQYEWSVDGTVIGNSAHITVPADKFENLESFSLSLVVINFLGKRSTTKTQEITVDSATILNVHFENGANQVVKRAQRNVFPMQIYLGNCAKGLNVS